MTDRFAVELIRGELEPVRAAIAAHNEATASVAHTLDDKFLPNEQLPHLDLRNSQVALVVGKENAGRMIELLRAQPGCGRPADVLERAMR